MESGGRPPIGSYESIQPEPLSVMGATEIGTDPKNLPGLLEQFCLKAAPEIWANAWREAKANNQPPAADWQRILSGLMMNSFPLVSRTAPLARHQFNSD